MPPKPQTPATTSAEPSKRPRTFAPKALKMNVRPTHFLSLPIGHHPELRDRVRALHEKIVPSGPDSTICAIEGIDKSILVDPRRLHFTLGVMALSTKDSEEPEAEDSETPRKRTLTEAIALLQSLVPTVNEITQQQPLRISLDNMGVLKTKREQAGVLYLGPSSGDAKSEDTVKVLLILDLVSKRFREEGFITDPPRPAVLHCTLINASHRKPRRIPRTFSYREIFDIVSPPSTGALRANAKATQHVDVSFGSWPASEIQLCAMGSHGPENEYVSCASIPLGV
ncbi:kinase A anchor protein [Mycena amicta]|nr:kinase A anchor protein [Mycena amicta]